jgi:hypothetical protein
MLRLLVYCHQHRQHLMLAYYHLHLDLHIQNNAAHRSLFGNLQSLVSQVIRVMMVGQIQSQSDTLRLLMMFLVGSQYKVIHV